jgi:hypothetical protein
VSRQDDIAEAAKEDLAFLQWVRSATTQELQMQFHYAVSWQRVAIERELERRRV